MKALQDELRQRNAELHRISRTDPLTGLGNRRHLDEQLRSARTSARRHGTMLSVAIIDVDQFKRINDTYGHASGDDVLCEVARRLGEVARAEDAVGRWGGEEFLVILPYCDVDASFALGERLRQAIGGELIETADGDRIPVTVSVGCATGHDAHVVERADIALYAAKERGRNRTVVLPGNDGVLTANAPSAAVAPSA
jgi:diguanylate cyclase (GGDEF)-like protein